MILNGVLVSYSKDFCQLHRTGIVNKVIAATTNIVVKQLVDAYECQFARVCARIHTHKGPEYRSLQP